MQSVSSIGYAEPVLIDKYLYAGPIGGGKTSLSEALVQGSAIFRDEGIRLHIHRQQFADYKVTLMWKNGGLYEGVARWSKLYKFLLELGIPFNAGWEVFHV